MGVIAAAIRHAIALGATPEQILSMVEDMEAQQISWHPDVRSAEIRRSKDRARKRTTAAEVPTDSVVTSIPRNSTETEISQGNQLVSQGNVGVDGVKEKVPHTPPKENNIIYITKPSNSSNLVTKDSINARGPIRRKPPTDGIAGALALTHFETFWKAYPRRVGKGAARKAYLRALAKTDTETLLMTAKACANFCRGKEPEFIAHPATWLNQERWLDEAVPGSSVENLRGPRWADVQHDYRLRYGAEAFAMYSKHLKEGKVNAVVRGDDEGQEGGTGPEEPEMAGISDLLPPLLRVDPAQENQAAVSAQTLPDPVPVRRDGRDEPEAQLLPDQQHDWGGDSGLLWLSGFVDPYDDPGPYSC